jgi:hypothetical protein
MAMSHTISRLMFLCAKLGIADLLAGGPQTSDDLAKKCNAHPGALYRLLRATASLGLWTEVSPRRFGSTPLGASLKSGDPGAARSTILALAGPWMWSVQGEFEHSLRTGRTGTEKALGMPIFDFFAKHPEEAALFNEAMIGVHGQEPEAVAKAFDFSGIGTLVDVGGGTGNLISAILRASPRLKGIIFDLPHVAGPARERLTKLGLADRCTVVPGSFFESVPAADAYIMSHIIHDWYDEDCLKILGSCKRANPKAKVMIVEMVLPPGDTPHPGKILDLVMLVGPGGMERTPDEYSALLNKAGYQMTRIVPTQSPVSIVEGTPR